MVRHGESIWNLENRFTGWCDVPLTPVGEADAKDAGNLMRDRSLKFDVAFTSNLERAWRTCAHILSAAGQSNVEVVKSWRLNERHYGLLQGHHKNDPKLIEVFGENQLMEWRKSYHTPPPSLIDETAISKLGVNAINIATTHMEPKYSEQVLRRLNFKKSTDINALDVDLPLTESL
jgi:2,3-bisphosphoglycerate-dependent phosphoglycerate mutase